MKPRSIELLAFDRDRHLQYEGKCKLQIDKLSKMLLVEPENEEFKLISAMFKWDFVMDKNIIFVFGEHKLNDFALVFDEERRCKKVYDYICKDKVQNEFKKEMIFQRFLTPICERMAITDETTSELKRILLLWIEKHDDEEREELIKLLKDKQIFDIIYLSKCAVTGKNRNISTSDGSAIASNTANKRTHDIRKRRHSTANRFQDNNDKQVKKQKLSKKDLQIVDQSLFKIVSVQTGFNFHRRLLVFTNFSKSHCLEYTWNHRRNQFYCIGCKDKRKKFIVAILDKDENGAECIKMADRKHVCNPIPYIPENYKEMKVFKKPDYEILENCNAVSGTILVIFNENDKNKCWEFRTDDVMRSFFCRKCRTVAKLMNKNTEEEYLELRDGSHKCEYISFEPEKYYHFKDFVVSPDFEIRTITTKNGEEKKRLIIFDKTDRNLCYVYSSQRNMFNCQSCFNKRVVISAKLLKNAEGEDYVILSTKKHICKPRLYSTLSNNAEIILHPPAFELMENNENGINKLFIFDSNDRSLCYMFSQRKCCQNGYYCLGCRQVIRNSKKKNDDRKPVFAQLCKNENGEYYVRLNDSKHACEPRKYEPEKYAKKDDQKCYDFFFFRQKRFPNSINVAIYHPENKSLCFRLNYVKSMLNFECNACKTKSKTLRIKIQKDENGKEYFNHDHKKHICKPIKVSTIKAPEFVILKREEINFEEKKKKKSEIDKSRIVKLPDFEFRPNTNGVENGTLFIFHSEDRSIGYKYFCNTISAKDKRYYCSKKLV